MLKSFKKSLAIFLGICLIVSMIAINPADVKAVAKNPIGGFSPGGSFFQMNDTQLNTFLNDIETTNALYLRLDIAWNVVQPNNSTTWNFSAYDRIINAVIDRGLKVIAMPTFAPSWANGGYSDNKYPPTAAHSTDWYNFVKACGDRYIPLGVDAWEMWNEPNINAFWKPVANVANYTNNVLKPGANAIRASATALGKSVTVITGGLSPAATNGTNISPLDFVTGIYSNGGKNYFDAIGHHPYCFPEGPYSTSTYSAFQQTISINQIMVNNNDGGKKIWGTELGWHTGSSSDGGVTEALQAQYVTQAYERWSSWSFTGPLIWHTYQDWGTDPNNREHNFGLKRYNNTFKPGWQAFINVMASTMPPSGQCDLIVTDISWTPVTPVTGNAVTFKATIKNQGAAASPAGIIHGVAFRLDGAGTTIWSDNYTSSIAPGASVTVTANGGVSGATWTATVGTHTVTAIVDDINRITNESNENNNSYSKNFTISDAQQTLFSTGLETGETQVTWANSVQSSSNVSGYTSSINPECSKRINEQAHTGTTSLMFSGKDDSSVTSYCVYKVFDVNLAITSGTKLSYWFYPQQENGRHVVVDILCTDGTKLTNTAAVDQNNIGFHPANARGTINTWNQVTVNMGQWLNGKTIDQILVYYDQGPATGQYRGYIDDILIQN